MKKAILAMALVAGSALAGPRISVGIGFGAPVAVVRPACPGPGYVWVDGYYGPSGVWVPGFWRPPVVLAPRIVEAPRVVMAPRVVVSHPYAYGHGREFHRDFRR